MLAVIPIPIVLIILVAVALMVVWVYGKLNKSKKFDERLRDIEHEHCFHNDTQTQLDGLETMKEDLRHKAEVNKEAAKNLTEEAEKIGTVLGDKKDEAQEAQPEEAEPTKGGQNIE